MNEPLQLLLIEDNPDDAMLLIRILEKEGFILTSDRVETSDEMQRLLKEKTYDLIISDFRLPRFNGEKALEVYHSFGLEIPFILVSGTIGEDIAVSMMKSGAADYIMKDKISRLGPAVRRELKDAEVRQQKRQVVEELKNAKERAEQSDRLKSTLLANLSHEFRTPLTGILGFAQVIEENSDSPEIIQNAKRIFKGGIRLMKTLDSIVWLSQLESGVQPVYKSFDLHKMISLVIRNAEEFITYKNLTVDLQVSGNTWINSDEELLAKAISAVLDNAIKYTRTGNVKVTVNQASVGFADRCVIQISDTGIGIDRIYLDTIFEGFKQVSEGFSRHYEGLGLGLTIARKISTLLQGDITAESTPGVGSTFTISIPSSPAAVTPAGSPMATAEMPKSSMEFRHKEKYNALVVEDNESNAALAAIYLQQKFYVSIALTGPEAVNCCKENKYDMILMDINLGPGMNGIEATRIIRGMEAYRDIPIIAMTGYTLYGDREDLLKAGCSHYLAKPFSREQFDILVSSLIK